MFNPGRLSLARKRQRLTARALAEMAGLSPDTISRLENGSTSSPDEATIGRLADVLGYPAEFFHDPVVEEIDTGAVSFRSFSKMSAKERDAATSAGSLGLQLNAWVETRFSLPEPDLLDLSRETSPSAAAAVLRQHWGLGEQPVSSVLALLETKGIRVFSLSENTANVNAFSFWRDGKPFVFLNNFKTAESSIFDAAHELGHLVLHRHGDPKDYRSTEQDANIFASAFLMPTKDVQSRTPQRLDVDAIIRMKARWRVSAMAMARRLSDLHLLSEWQYKSALIELGRRGYRLGEPIGVERERSLVWTKVLTQLWAERITKNDIAKSLHLPLDELEGLIWGLAGAEPRRIDTSSAKLSAVASIREVET